MGWKTIILSATGAAVLLATGAAAETAGRPAVSVLSYAIDEPRRLMIAWPEEGGPPPGETVDIVLKGPSRDRTFRAVVPQTVSVASGSRVSTLDLDTVYLPGEYRVTIPSHGLLGNAAIRIGDAPQETRRHRDDAWGTFYWITNTEHGPYPDAHLQDMAAPVFGQRGLVQDVSGGWFDAGDYGKYTVNGAYSVGLMLLTGLLAPEVLNHRIEPLAGGTQDWPDWLDIAAVELDWLLKMQSADGGVHHKAATRDWPGLDVKPQDDTDVKWIMPVSSTATADFAAVMALAAVVFQALPGSEAATRAQRYRDAAGKARVWLQRNPGLVMIEASYDGNDYGGPYTDHSDADERFFADAAWAALTRERRAIASVEGQILDRRAVLNNDPDLYWGGVDLLGFWALKAMEEDLSPGAGQAVDDVLRQVARQWHDKKQASFWSVPHGDAEDLPWGSNGMLATRGWHWLLWAHVSGDEVFVTPARDLRHWFFGRNPLGQTFVTGQGERDARNPHFRPTVSGAIALPDGFLVGGPNSGVSDSVAEALRDQPPMLRYVDHRDSFSTNEVAINWQAPWALYLSLLAALD